ncbi:hypothetical protein HHK36_018542 [Tetracentron sinense]|uniref:Uncharacterized protein n=1 Tax=Tetracentron sinense TaxID=13715 RepID=A0A834Z4K7_TETSI|nr:hypothetical protein HHK36_018542 [Tetracentron sinense]
MQKVRKNPNKSRISRKIFSADFKTERRVRFLFLQQSCDFRVLSRNSGESEGFRRTDTLSEPSKREGSSIYNIERSSILLAGKYEHCHPSHVGGVQLEFINCWLNCWLDTIFFFLGLPSHPGKLQ